MMGKTRKKWFRNVSTQFRSWKIVATDYKFLLMTKISQIFALITGMTFLLASNGFAQLTPAEAYHDRLENLVRDFGFDAGEQPTFDEPKFNKLMGRSRVAAGRAMARSERGRPASSAFWLSRCVAIADRATDFAIAANMSGSGYSDDLAGYGAFITQRLYVELGEEADIPVWAVMYLEQLHDNALASYNEEDWSRASRSWAYGVLIIEWLSS